MKNALVFSLSEVHDFFVFIIMHLIKLYLTTHNEVFKNGKTYKGDTYLIVSMKLFSSQSFNTIRAILMEAHDCEADAILDS